MQHFDRDICQINMEDYLDDSERLVRKIISGNAEAFRVVVDQNKRLVSHIVFRMIRNETDREDLCQDIFIRVYQNLSSFQFKSKLSTWIARIAYNTCGNYLEKKKIPLYEDIASNKVSIESHCDYSAQPDTQAELEDVSIKLRTEIDKLPAQFAAIITLYHLDDMSYREIGSIMNMPEGTVKSYLFRARKLLKDRLLTKYQMEDLWEASI